MEDKLRDKAERGVLDNMLSTAQSALAVGAGAVFLYRGGGRKFLADNAGVASRALGRVKEDMAQLGGRKIETGDLKRIAQNTFKGEDSYINQAKRDISDNGLMFRPTNQSTHLGKMANAVSQHATISERTLARPVYEYQKIIKPLATQFANELGTDELSKRKIGQFTEKVFKNAEELDKILAARTALKLEDHVSNDDVQRILQTVKTQRDAAEVEINLYAENLSGVRDNINQKIFSKEALDEQLKENKMIDTSLGDRALTYREVYADPDKFRGTQMSWSRLNRDGEKTTVKGDAVDFALEIQERVRQANKGRETEALESLYALAPDRMLRVTKDGGVHNLTEVGNIRDRSLDWFAATMPGKIAKVRDFREATKAPAMEVFNPSFLRADPVLAKIVNNDNNKHLLTVDEQIVRIFDRSYKVDEKGALNEVKELTNTRLLTKYGAERKMILSIAGNEGYRPTSGNKWLDALNIGKEGQPHVLDNIRSMFQKRQDNEWSGNALDDFSKNLGNTYGRLNQLRDDATNIEAQLAQEMGKAQQDVGAINALKALRDENLTSAASLFSQTRVVESIYRKTSYAPSQTDALKLADQMSGEAKDFMLLAAKKNEELMQSVISRYGTGVKDEFANPELPAILAEMSQNPRRAAEMMIIKENQGKLLDSNQSDKSSELLRIELAKEALLRHGSISDDGMDGIRSLIDTALDSNISKQNANRISDWAVLQQNTGRTSNMKSNIQSVHDLLDRSEDALNVYGKGSIDGNKYYAEMVENLQTMRHEHVNEMASDYGVVMRNANIEPEIEQGEFMHVKKMVSPLDLIRNVNDEQTWKAFGKQFTAGRKNIEDATLATTIPYFFGVRLSDALSPIGLGFGTQDKGSTAALVKAMVLKRGLPIIGGMTGYDYMNDMFGVATGQNITTTLMSAYANVDLGMRKITDATGLTDFLKDEKELNPFYRYTTGDEYQSHDERKDWYENGYSEMRKGRWWSFGGIQEFRGSQIQYYQPNFLRRATSNWKDESIYNNVWDKWSHSLIPTPTNPISPLIYALDPYWMERRFSEDRPYPMTGKMFTEETPWGPILNATIGEVIKPQKRMHTDRLDEYYRDSRVLIEAENRAVMEKARNQDGGHLVRFKDGAIEAVNYTGLGAPTPSSRVISVDGNGNVQSPGVYGQFEGVTPMSDVPASHPIMGGSGEAASIVETGIGNTFGFSEVPELSMRDKIAVSASGGNIFSGFVDAVINNTAIDQLSGMNAEVYRRAQVNSEMSSLGMPTGDGVVTTESIYKAGASFGSAVLENSEALSEMKGLSSGDDFLGEMAYTMRFAAGIYGYGAFRMFPGEAKTKLADASDITSPVRSFWDANLGGLGGGYLEIFRRFIPAANHKQEDFNPLLNTMPDWMPEKFRFGDPYAVLPKGEMRMPGRGFESLHELHPDEYGTYGAFDRMKILADIAPTSHEYKVWRDIAEKTVTDYALVDEMEEIKERAKKQGQAYEFFDYGFLGRSTQKEKAIIDEIIDKDRFTVVGSDDVYRMAGIEVKSGQGFDLSNYLNPGTEVLMTTDKNEYSGRSDDIYQSVSATIVADKVNINQQLVEEGFADKRSDPSAASMGDYTDFQILRGKAYEALSHLPVPYFSQKFFRIRDPLESWKQEMTYGTSYASWTNPIETFLMPAIERSVMSDAEVFVGAGAGLFNEWAQENLKNKTGKMAATGAFALANRGAFIGGFLGLATASGASVTRKAMNIGALVQMGAWAYTRKDEVVEGTLGGAAIGAIAGNMLGDVGKLKGGAIGAAVGLAITGMNSSILSDGVGNEYIPERTKEKWEKQEYFDRLNYIKYHGLYEKAASLAKRKEGVDIERMIKAYDKSQEENFALRQNLEEAQSIVQRAYSATDSRGQRILQEIEDRMNQLKTQEFAVSVGEYGKSALMYKQMMDSTVYGLSENASWAEMVRAVPQNERSHFIEFFKEKDPDKQKEILKYMSPYTQKILKIAWKQKPEETESNMSYFKGKHLPGPMWSGWKPDVDLKDVQLKTIQNEGMLLADFGFYESQLRDSDVIRAPAINTESDNPIGMYGNLAATLKGLGLTGVNVSVSPSTKTGIEVVANIIDTTMSAPAYIESKIRNAISF